MRKTVLEGFVGRENRRIWDELHEKEFPDELLLDQWGRRLV